MAEIGPGLPPDRVVPTIALCSCVDGLGRREQVARSATKSRDPQEKTRTLVRPVARTTESPALTHVGAGDSDGPLNGRALLVTEVSPRLCISARIRSGPD